MDFRGGSVGATPNCIDRLTVQSRAHCHYALSKKNAQRPLCATGSDRERARKRSKAFTRQRGCEGSAATAQLWVPRPRNRSAICPKKRTNSTFEKLGEENRRLSSQPTTARRSIQGRARPPKAKMLQSYYQGPQSHSDRQRSGGRTH